MAFTAVLGSPDAQLGNISVGATAAGNGTIRRTFVDCSIGGKILSARVSLGYDQMVGEAQIEYAEDPGGSYNDLVTVIMGAGNNIPRFTGLLKERQTVHYPNSITLFCRGQLSLADEYVFQYLDDPMQSRIYAESLRQYGIDGLLINQLVGSTNATDGSVVYQALAKAGVGNLDPGNIDDTGTVVGQNSPNAQSAWAWRQGESALAYVQRVDKVARMRTFETTNGGVFRQRVSGRPTGGSAMTFTDGVDIFSARGSRSEIGLKNGVVVEGFDLGGGNGPITFVTGSPPYEYFSSPMIERLNALDAGTGFSCEDVATDVFGEVDRETVRLTMTTPRDDEIGPGQIHSILSPRTLITEPLWVQRVDVSVQGGEFSQQMTYIGGGL